jgi:hypothetical protein
MTKPLFDQEVHEERRSRPAPLGEWMRVCRLSNQIKKLQLRKTREEVAYVRAEKRNNNDARKRKIEAMLEKTHKELSEMETKVSAILHKAFKDWDCQTMVLLDTNGCSVECFWEWPQQRRVFTFSFSDPLSVVES